MVIQAEDYSVDVQVVPKEEFSDRDSDSILNTVRQNLPGLSVTLTTVNSIAKTKANKWRPVITRVIRDEKGITQ